MRKAVRRLAGRQLVVVTGKGGVGKSAVAAALGTLAAQGGKRVLVLEIDPRENVHQMLGAPPSDGEIVEAAPGLYLQNLQPQDVVDRLVREKVRIEAIVTRVLASPVYRHFTAGAPGLKELAVLGHALLLAQGRAPGAPPLDLVVLDAPATGHGVSLLAAPQLVSEAIGHGPIVRLTSQVAELIGDPARCSVVVVTSAEEMPVTEALELRATLEERLDRSPELLVVNGLYPPFPAAKKPQDEAGLLWRDRRRLNEAELDRLRGSWPGGWTPVPLLPLDRGPELTAAIARHLAAEGRG